MAGQHVRDRPGGQSCGLRGRPGPAGRPWASGFRLWAKVCSFRLPAGQAALRLPLSFPAGLWQVGVSRLLPGEPEAGAPFGPPGPGGPRGRGRAGEATRHDAPVGIRGLPPGAGPCLAARRRRRRTPGLGASLLQPLR